MSAPMLSPDQLFTAQEVANLLRVHVDTFRRWCRQGKGPRVIRVGGAERYEAADVLAWINARKTRDKCA